MNAPRCEARYRALAVTVFDCALHSVVDRLAIGRFPYSPLVHIECVFRIFGASCRGHGYRRELATLERAFAYTI